MRAPSNRRSAKLAGAFGSFISGDERELAVKAFLIPPVVAPPRIFGHELRAGRGVSGICAHLWSLMVSE